MSLSAIIAKSASPSLAQSFADDLNAAFSGDESGRIYKYLYLDPRGAQASIKNNSGLAQTLANSDHYYVFRNGLWLVKTYAERWASSVGTGRPMIELGLGTGKALEKTETLVRALKPSHLIINDHSEEYLASGEAALSSVFSELAIQKTPGDFLALRPGDIKVMAPVVFLQGCTLSNYDDTVSVLKHIASLSGPNADIFIDFDTNQNLENLTLAYGGPAQIEQRKQILRYAEDLFAPANFSADDFDWQCEWRPAQNLLLQKLSQVKPRSFAIDGMHHQGPSSLIVSKMYKHPMSVFNSLANAANTPVQQIYRDFEGKLAFAHLKPI